MRVMGMPFTISGIRFLGPGREQEFIILTSVKSNLSLSFPEAEVGLGINYRAYAALLAMCPRSIDSPSLVSIMAVAIFFSRK